MSMQDPIAGFADPHPQRPGCRKGFGVFAFLQAEIGNCQLVGKRGLYCLPLKKAEMLEGFGNRVDSTTRVNL